VVARLARIVTAFDLKHESLSLTSLAQRSGLPLSTTQRLVADLLTHRFLERGPDGCLRPGALIRHPGAQNQTQAFVPLRDAAVPMMESVYAVLRAQITLAVLDNDETLYLERVSRGSTATNITQKVARLPLLLTPSGLVLLAHQSPEYQEQTLASQGDGSENLRAVLAQARIAGYVMRPGIITEGTLAVSVPVLGDHDGLPAALTAVIEEAGAQVPLTVAVLRAASYAISAAMGTEHPSDQKQPLPENLLASRRL